MRETKAQRGITLIALVITIIVMLILVGVTISMAVNGGLFKYAENAAKGTNDKVRAEQELSNGGVTVDGKVYSSITEYLNKDKEPISKETSFVGKYADVDGDGDVDGIIYADLAKGNTGKGFWRVDGYADTDGVGAYSIPKIETGLKEYYVSGTANGAFGDGIEVITAKAGEGKDRFYVMALTDTFTSEVPWYASRFVSGTIDATTLVDFGKGKINTENMIKAWNEDTDKSKNINDLWGKEEIKKQLEKGWFVPSRAEWAAFGAEIKITTSNYEGYGLNNYYWSSSYCEEANMSGYAWGTWFNLGILGEHNIDGQGFGYTAAMVRLSTTF